MPFYHADEYERELVVAEAITAGTVAARILIADEVATLKVMERWTSAARKFAHGKDIVAFGNQVSGLSHDIRQAALKSYS